MTTQQTQIYNNTLTGNAENLSAVFDNGFAFYLVAPGSSLDYQIDIFLQVQLTNTVTRMVRLDPMNVSTTERITVLPPQIVELGLPMRLSIVPSEPFDLEVTLLQSDCYLCDVQSQVIALGDRLDDLETKIDQLTAAQSNSNSNLTTILNLILTAVGIPAPIPLPVPATAAQQAFFFLQ